MRQDNLILCPDKCSMSRIHYKSFTSITDLARNLRKNQTQAEVILWRILRKRQISGFKFLKQHPVFYRIDKDWVDFYIADFYCAELRLIFEIDGAIHEYTKECDYQRDSRLASKGILVTRLKNEEVYDSKRILAKIIEIAHKRFEEISET